jgi:hypothetical protein
LVDGKSRFRVHKLTPDLGLDNWVRKRGHAG